MTEMDDGGWECPDCDETAEEEQEMFLHRIRQHTDADTSDGSFNIYHPEIWSVYTDMAVVEAMRRSDVEDPTVGDLVDELHEMGIPVQPED